MRDHSIGYTNGATRLGDETTLAALLADAGYDTAAFIGNSMLHRRLGLNRGFAHYDDRLPDSEANRLRFERGAEKTTLPATRWLAAPRSSPFFLWVQYNDPHGPYTPPSGYAPSAAPVDGTALPALREQHGVGGIPAYQVVGDERTPAQYQARYTGEIRYFDEWLGKLLYATERNANGRETVIVLTADHGESLGEDGIWFAHGNATTPNLVHVPLLLRAPNVAAARVSSLVHHVDVVPTLLDLIGLPPIPNAAGLSLLPLVREGKSLPERTLFSDVGNDVSAYRGDRFARLTLVEWNGETSWRLVTHQWKPDGSWAEAPAEENLEREVIEYTKHRVPTLQAPQLTPAAEAGLRALGYAD